MLKRNQMPVGVSSFRKFIEFRDPSEKTFTDVKQSSYASAIEKIKVLISTLYDSHNYLLKSTKLSEKQRNDFKKILKEQTSLELLEHAIAYLTTDLYLHFNVPAVILIGEYDTPIQEAYLKGYYQDLIKFMVNLLASGLKDKGSFKTAVLTGITRVLKESLFSGLNHIKIYTLLDSKYSLHFGFIESEMRDLLDKTLTQANFSEIKSWYNGYQCRENVLYNPWFIINCIAESGKLKPYWVNTSSNTLAKKLLLKSGTQIHGLLQNLKARGIQKIVKIGIAFSAKALEAKYEFLPV